MDKEPEGGPMCLHLIMKSMSVQMCVLHPDSCCMSPNHDPERPCD